MKVALFSLATLSVGLLMKMTRILACELDPWSMATVLNTDKWW